MTRFRKDAKDSTDERAQGQDREGAGTDGCASAASNRRGFLTWLSVGIGAVLGAAMTVPWIAMFLSPLRRRDPPVWRSVGRVEDFPVGATIQVTYRDPSPLPWAGFASRNAAWLRREDEARFTAFTSYCTHVGCPVRWEPGAQLFMCPCHGGAFYPNGAVAAGPPPRPLDEHPVRVRDGAVEVQAIGVPVPREEG